MSRQPTAPKTTDDRLLASPFLYRFAVPCHRYDSAWSDKGIELSDKHSLPCFASLDAPAANAPQPWADVRAGWNDQGIYLTIRVSGKRQPPWCRASRIEDSDGLAVWINTRNTSQIHRASRFCHEFRFFPAGGGTKMSQPFALHLLINRAKENPTTVDAEILKVYSERRVDGYLMAAFIPANAMTGYDPEEHPQLGFHYAVVDHEMGLNVMTVGEPFPYDSDPSLWSTLDLV